MGSYKLFEWRMNRCSSACLLSVLRWGPIPPPLLKGGAHLQRSIALYREVMVVGVLLLRQSGESTTPTRVRMPVLTASLLMGWFPVCMAGQLGAIFPLEGCPWASQRACPAMPLRNGVESHRS